MVEHTPVPQLGETPPALQQDVVQLWFVSPFPKLRSVERLHRLLSPDEAERAARFRIEADRTGYTVLHAAARIVLGGLCGRSPASLEFRCVPGYRPVLDAVNGPDFSLSRSRDIAMIGVATSPLGVDVEAIRPIPDVEAIASRFFAPNEARGLAALPEARRLDAFFACWSRKEAFVKAIGLGLAAPLDRFEVDIDPSHPAILTINGECGAAAQWSLWAERRNGCWSAAAIARSCMTFRPMEVDLSHWT